MNAPRCLLWDFGDTLCDERFIWSASPAWMALYETFEDGPGLAWCRGDLDTQAFAQEIAPRVGLSTEAAVAFMTARVEAIQWFPYTYAFFRARHVPQAIVTVNPDFFSTVIAPRHGLGDAADVIVTSWEERSLDKGALCRTALDRMAIDCEPGEALLIDNRKDCLEAWARLGGRGYHFHSDAAFAREIGIPLGGPTLPN